VDRRQLDMLVPMAYGLYDAVFRSRMIRDAGDGRVRDRDRTR
jgi:hypothetical protein